MRQAKSLNLLIMFLLWLQVSGCSTIVTSATNKLAGNVSNSILNNKDPKTVKTAIPSYLILMDAMILNNPESAKSLQAAAQLNSAYASLFINDVSRQKVLTDKAFNYASQAMCMNDDNYCNLQNMPFEKFEPLVMSMEKDSLPDFFVLASSWAGWVSAHSDDFNAIAQLSRIELIMKKIVELDENYQHGGAHLYLGGLATILPPALGGKPEVGKMHFEKAIAISNGRNLLAKVTYAERYARLVFDQELHDRLLNEVLKADAEFEGLTMTNMIAKQKAQQLLDSAEEYF